MEQDLIKQFNETNQEIAQVQAQIGQVLQPYNDKLKTLQEKDTELRAALKESMEKHDVKKFEDDFVAITYVAPTKRRSIDTKKLQAESPEVYEKYLTESDVKSSIRIKFKEQN